MTGATAAAAATAEAMLAEAYRDAALARANMRAAAEALERMRAAMAAPPSDRHAVFDALNGVVNECSREQALPPILAQLRDAWCAAATSDSLQDLARLLRADPEAGFSAWLNAVGLALAAFHLDVAHDLARAPLPFPPGASPAPARIAAWTDLARLGRWIEVGELFATLGREPRLSPLARARALAFRAEIEVSVEGDLEAASATVAEAEALLPGDWRVLYTKARRFAAQGAEEGEERALQSYADAIQAEPEAAPAHVGLGELLLKRGDLAGAEAEYRKAARCSIGPAEGHCALIELCGHPTFFADRRDRIPDLVERTRLVRRNDGDVYVAMLTAAQAFQANGDTAAALAWCGKAVQQDAARLQAYLQRGYLHLEAGDRDAARLEFRRVAEIAPAAPDGWWGLSNLAEEEEDWAGVLRFSLASLRRAPGWAGAIRGRLEMMAASLYQSRGQPRMAELAYRCLRRFLGASYEASYRNLVGNLRFFQREYARAASEYRRAIAVAGDVPRYAANLALALEAEDARDPASTAALPAAIESARRAHLLDPTNAEFSEIWARLQQTQSFVAEYGADARARVPDSARLRVLLEVSLLPVVTENGRLRGDFTRRIARIRQAIAAEKGFTLCGVDFRDWRQEGIAPASCAIEIMGERVWQARIEPPDSADALEREIEAAVRAYLPALFCHEEASSLAGQCEEGAAIAGSPFLLNAFVHRARVLLRLGGRVDAATVSAAVAREPVPDRAAARAPAEARTAPPLPRVRFVAGPESSPGLMDRLVDRALADLWARTGVSIPRPEIARDASLESGAWTVALGGDVLSDATLPGLKDENLDMSASWIASALARRADRLLASSLVAFYLHHLRKSVPNLIRVAEALLPGEALTRALRGVLAEGRSLRSLLLVLDDFARAAAEIEDAAIVASSAAHVASMEGAAGYGGIVLMGEENVNAPSFFRHVPATR